MNDLKIQVIPVESLEPGDYVLITADRTKVDPKLVAKWAEDYFRKARVRVGIMLDGVTVQVIKGSSVNFREFL